MTKLNEISLGLKLAVKAKRALLNFEPKLIKTTKRVVQAAPAAIVAGAAAQELQSDSLGQAAIIAPFAGIMAADVIRRIKPKKPLKEEEMKIREALINLSENKLEEMNKNIREAIIRKAADALEEKKIEIAKMFYGSGK